MNSKQLRVIIISIVVLAAIVVLFIIFRSKTLSYNISQAYSVPFNLSSAEAYSANTIVYSNGQELMLYNYMTGKSDPLSPVVNITSGAPIDTISVSSNDKFVLFHDRQVATGGVLYKQLTSQGLNPGAGYWWVYNVDQQSFQALPVSTTLAKLSADSVEALATTGSGQSLTSYDASTLAVQATIKVSNTFNFIAANNGFVLQTTDNSLLFTEDGIVSQLLAKDATIVALAPNSQQAVIVSSQDGSSRLALLNLKTHTQTAISGNITGQPDWLSSGEVLYMGVHASGSSETTNIYSYSLSNKKTALWDLSGSAHQFNNSASLELGAIIGPQTALVSTSSIDYYLMGSGLAQPPAEL